MGGFPWEWLAPLALVALGAALILRPGVHAAADKQDAASGTTPPATPPPADTKSAEAASPAGPAPAALPEPEATADESKADEPPKPDAGDEPEATSESDPESDSKPEGEGEDEKKSDADDKDKNPPFEGRLLRRSTSDRVISGVCGGLAKYLKLDSTLVRLGWALLTVGSLGIGLFAYLAMMLAVPEEDD
ncbi:PspC domain-containing protein [bacterium]|nr:PspC domain-containing protein [bacterium]